MSMSVVVRSHEMNENILVVDDEKELADLVEVYLKTMGTTSISAIAAQMH